MKRAVITGPTGSIGIALINELEANGIEVEMCIRDRYNDLSVETIKVNLAFVKILAICQTQVI